MTMNHLSFSFTGFALCARCVRWSVLFLGELFVSLRLFFSCVCSLVRWFVVDCLVLSVFMAVILNEWIPFLPLVRIYVHSLKVSFILFRMCSVCAWKRNLYFIYILLVLELTWFVGWLTWVAGDVQNWTIHTQLAYQAAMHVVWSERLETRNSEFLSSVFTRFIFAALALWLERFLLVKLFSAPPPHVHMCVCAVCLSHVDVWMFLVRE